MNGSWMIVFFICSLLIHGCATNDQQSASAGKKQIPQRTLQDVKDTFDRSKGEIYAVYNNRLKTKPDLKGRIVYRITVASNGTVVQTSVLESTLNDAEIENKVKAIITNIDFGPARSSGYMSIAYPVEFLPH
jgi:TonB family protein